MIRPLDEALIDFEKTYRQTFKQPLYEHEQYTKRQLIYNYAAVGSEFIYKTAQKQLQNKESKPLDLQDIIDLWNNPTVKLENFPTQSIKKAQQASSVQEDEDLKNLKKQVQVIKKEKMIVKNRHQRNIFFRKQLEVLFRTKNLNMLSVDSMRSHLQQLKPYISYNSRNRVRKDRQGDKFSSRNNDEYRQNHGRNQDNRDSHRRYDERQESRRNQDRQNHRKNDYYGRQYQRRDDFKEKGRPGEEHREHSRKGDSFERHSQGLYSIKNPSNYFSPQQYHPQTTPYSVSQFGRNDIPYNKYAPTIEISSSHNQNYQPGQRVIYPPPPQVAKPNAFYQYDPSVNSQYGSFRGNSTDAHKNYQDQ